MALTLSPANTEIENLPTFELQDVFGQTVHSDNLKPKNGPLWVMFICNHCPYVQAIEDRILQTATEIQNAGGKVVAICSNDPSDYPEDAPEALKKRVEEKNYPFHYLIDPDQSVARAFHAVCTPDFFIFGANGKLRYRGRLDDNWKNPAQVQNRELYSAFQNILKTPQETDLLDAEPSMGCSIKWKN